MTATVSAAAALLACGPTRSGLPACSRSDRTGTYLFQLIESAGTCGALDDQLFVLENGRIVGDGTPRTCTDQTLNWSDDECAVDATFTCTEAEATSVWDTRTEQVVSDGTRLEGTASLERRAPDSATCASTYELTATRQ